MSEDGPGWHNVICRAWRNTPDEELARHLFDLVADVPAGWKGTLGLGLWGGLYGAFAGLLARLWGLRQGWTLGGAFWDVGELLPWGEVFPALAAGAVSGVAAALAVRLVLGRRLTWRHWLLRLGPGFWPARFFPLHTLALLVGFLGWVSIHLFTGLLLWAVLVLGIGRLRVNIGGQRRVLDWALLRDGFGRVREILRAARGVAGRPSRSHWPAYLVVFFLGLVVLGWVALRFALDAALWNTKTLWLYLGALAGLVLLLLFGPAIGLALLLAGAWLGSLAWGGLPVGPLVGLAGFSLVALMFGATGLLQATEERWRQSLFWFWWSSRPHPFELEAALRQAVSEQPAAHRVWAEALHILAERRARPGPVEAFVTLLSNDDWVERFVSRHVLMSLGGEAVPALGRLAEDKRSPHWATAVWLLQCIGQDTLDRLGGRTEGLLCARCLVRPAALHVHLYGPDLFYYGCRGCGQSREFVARPAEVVAVLDTRWEAERVERDGVLWVNALRMEAPFDFDRVLVTRAADEQVERFALQVGNDTDPARRRQYGRMRCTVREDCGASENSLRVLRSVFGRVEEENGKSET